MQRFRNRTGEDVLHALNLRADKMNRQERLAMRKVMRSESLRYFVQQEAEAYYYDELADLNEPIVDGDGTMLTIEGEGPIPVVGADGRFMEFIERVWAKREEILAFILKIVALF